MKYLKKFNESNVDQIDVENIFLELEEENKDLKFESKYYDNEAIIIISYTIPPNKTEDTLKNIKNLPDLELMVARKEKEFYVLRKLKVAAQRLDYYGYNYEIRIDAISRQSAHSVHIRIRNKDLHLELSESLKGDINDLKIIMNRDYDLELLDKNMGIHYGNFLIQLDIVRSEQEQWKVANKYSKFSKDVKELGYIIEYAQLNKEKVRIELSLRGVPDWFREL